MALKAFMARVERGSEGAAVEEAAPAAPAARPVPRTVAPSTAIDAASVLEGKLRCKQMLRIDGSIEGEIQCENTVLVGEQARVIASIEAEAVQIAGVVEGNIAARRKITLERTAVVVGDLTTPGIVIEEGAKLKGRIVIGSDVEGASRSEAAGDAAAAQPPKKPAAAGPKRNGSAPQPLVAAP